MKGAAIILRYMSEEKFNYRLKKIQNKNLSKERKAILKAEKRKCARKLKLPSTSKLVLLIVFLLCIEIVGFCQYAMIALGDASAMYVMIGVPTTLVPVVLAYYWKSKAENSKDGITYDMAMLDRSLEDTNTIIDEPKG